LESADRKERAVRDLTDTLDDYDKLSMCAASTTRATAWLTSGSSETLEDYFWVALPVTFALTPSRPAFQPEAVAIGNRPRRFCT
jgi:hypothetical protein